MNNRVLPVAAIILALAFSSHTAAGENHARETASPRKSQVNLSPELKKILLEEMAAIQKGMMDLVPAIASADWRKAEETGEKLHDSYIMKQRLSDRQIEELHHSLPPAFKELDHSFHHGAKMLARAARKGDAELVNFYFYKLNEACIKCHSKYAAHRFPAFSPHKEHKEQHH